MTQLFFLHMTTWKVTLKVSIQCCHLLYDFCWQSKLRLFLWRKTLEGSNSLWAPWFGCVLNTHTGLSFILYWLQYLCELWSCWLWFIAFVAEWSQGVDLKNGQSGLNSWPLLFSYSFGHVSCGNCWRFWELWPHIRRDSWMTGSTWLRGFL